MFQASYTFSPFTFYLLDKVSHINHFLLYINKLLFYDFRVLYMSDFFNLSFNIIKIILQIPSIT